MTEEGRRNVRGETSKGSVCARDDREETKRETAKAIGR